MRPVRAHPALYGEGLPAYVLDWLDHDAPGEYWAALDVSERLYPFAIDFQILSERHRRPHLRAARIDASQVDRISGRHVKTRWQRAVPARMSWFRGERVFSH
jgi:hypothetical protein